MDQLKQVLKYQFWILLAVALILPFVGWTMATSGLLTEVEARTTELRSLDDSLKVVPDDPNKDWETGLEAINRIQAVQPATAARQLYDRQLLLMKWPAKMPDDPSLFQTKHQEYYREIYKRGVVGQPPLIDEVRKIVNPYDEDMQTGLVIYDEALLPVADNEWVSQAPSIEQIKAAQEDLWLLSAILKQIAAVNEEAGAKTQFEAPVRQIIELYLRGGSTAKAGGGGAAKAGSGAGAAGAMSGDTMKGMGGGGSMSTGGSLGQRGSGDGGVAIASPKINPDDDLGPEVSIDKPGAGESKAGAGGAGAKGAMTSGMSAAPPGGSSGGLGSGGSSASARWSSSKMGRYREDKAEYKTRGFYLEVVMDHRRIPELLASLANADWPVNILHVQEADFKDEDLADAGGGGAGLSGMGGRSMGAAGPSMGGGGMGGAGGKPPGMGAAGAPPGARPGAGPAKGAVRSSDEGGEGPTSNRSPLDDPNLANVTIVGVMYIFNKPKETPGTAPGSPAPSAAPATAPVAAAPATGGAAATTGDAAKASPAAGAADSETAADDAKSDQPAPAAATTPEKALESKSENEPDKGNTPGKDGSPETGAPEKAGKS